MLALLCAFALAHPASAQTYTPKAIHFEGSPGLDPADLLRLSGLREGVPLTRAEIEAGLQKLADTGSFTDIGYTVNNTALTVKLTTAAGSQMLPVRFANFVWWQPEELERAVEARVPLYHGELALTGSLTDLVKAALVALAHDKGLNITVDAERSTDPATQKKAIAFSIEQPSIRFGTLHIDAAQPAFGPTTGDLIGGLRGQDFDSSLASFTITHDGADIFHNAGFLDAVVDPPVFSAPHSEGAAFTIDATATVHRGELYRITQLQLAAQPPLAESDLRKLSDLKTGAPASPMGLTISGQRIALAYQSLGYLTADAHTASTIDNVGHAATYAISVTPGPLFHLARIDASALPEAAQSRLAHDSRLTPGVVADAHLFGAILEDFQKANLHAPSLDRRLDRAAHTVTLVLQSGTAPRVPHQPTAQ
ncbi:MAG TPA: POTRA domain-containing protein [Acidobacteriaceae bacterium]